MSIEKGLVGWVRGFQCQYAGPGLFSTTLTHNRSILPSPSSIYLCCMLFAGCPIYCVQFLYWQVYYIPLYLSSLSLKLREAAKKIRRGGVTPQWPGFFADSLCRLENLLTLVLIRGVDSIHLFKELISQQNQTFQGCLGDTKSVDIPVRILAIFYLAKKSTRLLFQLFSHVKSPPATSYKKL